MIVTKNSLFLDLDGRTTNHCRQFVILPTPYKIHEFWQHSRRANEVPILAAKWPIAGQRTKQELHP